MKKQILEHLKNSGHYDDVGLGLSLAAVRDEPVIHGNNKLWVLQMRTDPKARLRDIGPALQQEMVVYGIAITVKAYNDRTGEKTDDIVDQLIAKVRSDLFDFMPEELADRYDPLELAGGDLLKFAGGSVIYIERFSTKRLVSKETLI